MAVVEVNLRRLLARLQAQLGSKFEGDADSRARLWSFIATAQEMLETLADVEGISEDALRGYERKLAFISEVLAASEGKRPAVAASVNPVQLPGGDAEHAQQKAMLAEEERAMRAALLGPEGLRRRLGLEPARANGKEALDDESKTRQAITDDMMDLSHALRESSLNMQRTLAADKSRLQAVDELMTRNLESVGDEVKRIDETIYSSSMNCRKYVRPRRPRATDGAVVRLHIVCSTRVYQHARAHEDYASAEAMTLVRSTCRLPRLVNFSVARRRTFRALVPVCGWLE